jgi:hypothetical protein
VPEPHVKEPPVLEPLVDHYKNAPVDLRDCNPEKDNPNNSLSTDNNNGLTSFYQLPFRISKKENFFNEF